MSPPKLRTASVQGKSHSWEAFATLRNEMMAEKRVAVLAGCEHRLVQLRAGGTTAESAVKPLLKAWKLSEYFVEELDLSGMCAKREPPFTLDHRATDHCERAIEYAKCPQLVPRGCTPPRRYHLMSLCTRKGGQALGGIADMARWTSWHRVRCPCAECACPAPTQSAQSSEGNNPNRCTGVRGGP
jgi:hypothetical protein